MIALQKMNEKHPVKVDSIEDVENYILDYISSHNQFVLNDLVYSINADEPYRIRDLAHRIINPKVAHKELRIVWNDGYVYERI
jgi:hypothetical protein